MKILKGSHLDHGLTVKQIAWIQERFLGESTFFIDTVTLPTELGCVPCLLYGPIMGDAPIQETQVFYASRGKRPYYSRLVNRVARPSRQVTVIAGPDGDEPCVLYTAFGGPLAPREPGDRAIKTPEELEESRAFWGQHALGYRMKRAIHMTDIRYKNNAGINLPVCFSTAQLLDMDKTRLPQTSDFAEVTCKHCLRMTPKHYPWLRAGHCESDAARQGRGAEGR
jgi:hypothetical protein